MSDQRIRAIEKIVEKIPPRFLGSTGSVERATLKTGAQVGQLLVAASAYGSALYGVVRSATRITSLTTDVDPTATGAIAQNGIGRALLSLAGGGTESVLVVVDDRMIFATNLPEGAPILCTVGTIGSRKAVFPILP